MTINLNRIFSGAISAITLSVIGLIAIQLSLPAQALDLGKSLKEIIKEKSVSEPNSTDTVKTDATSTPPDSTSTNADNDNGQAKAPVINWKNPTQAEEINLGKQITGSILGASPLVQDDGLQTYVNQVGKWVAMQSERPDLPWHFGIIDSQDLNAFAAPGGYILVTKGLYQSLENEAQLAGVLGHEIAHVVKKHQLKILQKQALLGYGTQWIKSKVADNQLTKKAIGTSAEISARSLDKTAEYEADRMGMVLAYRAGYDIYGLPEVLQMLGQVNSADDSVILLFKTHPMPNERIAKISESAGNSLDKLAVGQTLENRLYKLKN
jgi:beta-barrel assembly-enhancing protease